MFSVRAVAHLRPLASLAAIATLVASAVSCAKNDESILVSGALPLTAGDAGGCTADAGSTDYLGIGIVDVSFNTSYLAAFSLLNNRAPNDVNQNNSGIDNSEMQLRDVDVKLTMPQDPSRIDEVEEQDPALVEYNLALATNSFASGDSLPVFAEIREPTLVALRESIYGSGEYSEDARLDLLMEVTFNALRSGNEVGNSGVVKARPFTLPIEVCYGCLRSCDPATCTEEDCAAPEIGSGLCGNAQEGAVVPLGCSGL